MLFSFTHIFFNNSLFCLLSKQRARNEIKMSHYDNQKYKYKLNFKISKKKKKTFTRACMIIKYNIVPV